MIDIRQTPVYAKYLRKIGWQVFQINHVNCFIKKIPLVGSVMKIQRPETIPLNKIQELARTNRVFQIIIEPKNDLDAKYLLSNKYRLSQKPYLPTKTLHLDLTKSTDSLIKGFKKDVRYAIRKKEQSSILELQLNEIERFRDNWKKAVRNKRYIPPLAQLLNLKKTFSHNALFITTKSGSAGAIFLIGDQIGYYWQAFSNKEGRRSLAQYRVIWEAIKKLKSLGVKILDFEGVYDKRFPNKKWLGFSHFKISFGGDEIEYPGAYTKTYPLAVLGRKVSF